MFFGLLEGVKRLFYPMCLHSHVSLYRGGGEGGGGGLGWVGMKPAAG